MSELNMKQVADYVGAMRPAVDNRQFGKGIIGGVAASLVTLAMQVGAPSTFTNAATNFGSTLASGIEPVAAAKPTVSLAPVVPISKNRVFNPGGPTYG